MTLRVVDLTQIGANQWRLRGETDAFLYREEGQTEEGFPTVKWVVTVDTKGKPLGKWGNMQSALAQAFAVATGNIINAAKQSARGR